MTHVETLVCLTRKTNEQKREFMKKKQLLQFSLITLIIGVCVLAISFFFFHFVTDEGIHLIWNDEAGKPFVTLLIGILFVFASAISALSAWIFYKPTEEK